MKNILLTLIIALPFALNAQTMKWVPSQSVKQHLLCYSLEYTPNTSGVLTSYTTAFFITCTSSGSPVVKNESVVMTNNCHLIDGCTQNHLVLMNSSGNTGSGMNNTVAAGVPVILHQVCFSIPNGESITIREDETTDLTTSVDMASGGSVTEYPDFAEMVIQKHKPHISRPLWLDFKTVIAGNFTTQLDWTTSDESNNSHFIIERSLDGNDFTAIGRIDATANPGRINSYQYLDKTAILGKNYYRLQQVNQEGKITYSPVREVTFLEKPFSVIVTPNPADQFLLVDIQSPSGESRIKLIDPSGTIVIDEKNDSSLLKTRLDIEKLPSGRYTLIVETDKNKFTENIVVIH